MPVTNHSENCLMVASMDFSRLMNSSSIFISSMDESIVKRLRIGTPNLDRRSNLRRISYFSRIMASSDTCLICGAAEYDSALKLRIPPTTSGPTFSNDGTRFGAGGAAGAEEPLNSSKLSVGMSMVSMLAIPPVTILGFTKRSVSIYFSFGCVS